MAELLAGAASVSIQEVILAHRQRVGEKTNMEGSQWPQKLRCLILRQVDELVVIFHADWGRWRRLFDETRAIVKASLPNARSAVLCFGTWASYDIDMEGFRWAAVDPKSKYYDAQLRDSLLEHISKVFHQAHELVRPVYVSMVTGSCTSATMNCYWGPDRIDPSVNVVRIADREGRPIAALVDYSSRGDDRVHGVVSGGFAGAIESTVQRVYDGLPVFYFNRSGADHFPAFADPAPEDFEEAALPYQDFLGPFLTQEYDRLGRVLGGEVIKLLAEAEVSGSKLHAINERWRYTCWSRTAPGYAVSSPAIASKELTTLLEYSKLPSVEECEARVRQLDQCLRTLKKSAPGELNKKVRQPITPEQGDDTLHRLMKLGSQRAYWGSAAGRAKKERRYERQTPPKSIRVVLVRLSADLAIVCFPSALGSPTVEAIKRVSPFRHTLVWGALSPMEPTHIIPEQEKLLGGVHAGINDYTQESIDAMVDLVATGLRSMSSEGDLLVC